MFVRASVSLFVVVALCFLAPTAGATQYVITDLGTLFGTGSSSAYDVNDVGQVTGWSSSPVATYEEFFWENGVMTEVTPGRRSSGGGISNPSAEHPTYVVGGVQYVGSSYHAFYWSVEGGLVELSQLGPGYATGVNDKGAVVGWMGAGDVDQYDAFVYHISKRPSGNYLVNLGLGLPYDINESGLVVGMACDGSTGFWPCMWVGTTRSSLSIYGRDGRALAVNDLGQIVGYEDDLPFLWHSGTVTYLPTLGDDGQPWDINNQGTIVGTSEGRACLWEGGVIYDLNDLVIGGQHWTLYGAQGINEEGQIVGYGQNSLYNYVTRAFLLTPIPEPGVFALVALGALILLRRNK